MSKAKIVGENTTSLTNPNNSLNASFANHKEQKKMKKNNKASKNPAFRTHKSIT
ncbi:TPA: hypothetical protein ACNH1M_002041 [Enterobacter cloacae]|uniref:hypothetical protein n=1 Tax=Enterobacter cloacae TaxID=550 RepID=UPI00254FA766|nr:hypothetical protein [Enterobacter cloacae]